VAELVEAVEATIIRKSGQYIYIYVGATLVVALPLAVALPLVVALPLAGRDVMLSPNRCYPPVATLHWGLFTCRPAVCEEAPDFAAGGEGRSASL
jgi:hypothetical protein